jgi:integrase
MSAGRGSVIKRGDTYSVVLSRGTDPLTNKRLRDWHGPYRTKREAEQARTKLLGDADHGDYVKPEQMTVAEFLDGTWLPAIKATVRPTTAALYAQVVKNHLKPGVGSVRLQGLTAPALNKFYAQLLATGRRDGTGAGLSTRSTRIVHTVLHRALRDALKWRLVSHNVAAEADPPVSRSKEAVTWSGEQTSAFLKSVAADRLVALFRLEAATGMRRGEVCGLRWSDVDLDGASLRVSQTIVEVERQLQFSEPKTGSSRRTLRLDPVTVKALRDHHRRQLKERMALGPLWKGAEDLVFTRPDGSPVPPLWLTRYFARRVKAAGLPPATFHGMRHSYLSGLIRDGQSVRAVSARAGHANATITLNTYSHVLPGDDEQLALAGAARLGG